MTYLNFERIGAKIKERRLSLGITQEAIANFLDVNPSHISNIECGRAHPSLTALVKIANFLHCSVDLFLIDEYTFTLDSEKHSTLEDNILNKLQYCTESKKEKLLQIMDLL